ncbi:NEDD4-binding protein 2 [Astyanax mexicanus]|uniref:NEDD4-binding protein 2 n=1 Tax=Astyanax mexicanus TaxID=7994 RepID=A0A8B9HDK0_ASTMX|nr:NEDD4-binding protein 2 [Astyanax mexicanus]
MPKKRRNGHSPGRGPPHAADIEGSGAMRRAAPQNSGPDPGSIEPGYPRSSAQNREEIVLSMQEMFSHLDPAVIHLLLSEADFNVENAMDSLLELSNAAETTTQPSGFEMAAALLDRQPRTNQMETSKKISDGFTAPDKVNPQRNQSPETTHLTEEFDYLLDQELGAITALQGPSGTQPAVLDLHPLDVENDSKSGSLSSDSSTTLPGQAHRGASPVNELSFGGAACPKENNVSVDFSHLTEDSYSRPSAFKAYCRPGTFPNRTVPTAHPESLHTPAMFWNIKAPVFQPRVGSPGPRFTPVMRPPHPWNGHPFSTAQWLASRPVSQAPLKPSATVPKSWTLPPVSRLILEGPVLVLLRGAPGSGKTTLASAMLEHNPGGVVLSTDEYFTRNGTYHYNPDQLGEAHSWNHVRAKEAFEKGYSPIIIDNTNMQCWEMKPYVSLALKHKYRVLFREPETWWKTKPRELEKRTKHGVTKEKIRRMLEHQDRYVSVQNIMASQPKPTAVFGVDVDVSPQQPLPGGLNRPDLVGDSRFGGHLSSSLPDVSSVGQNFVRTDAAEGEVDLHSSKESMSSQENIEKQTQPTESPESELLDGENLDWELDHCIPPSDSTGLDITEDSPCNPDVLEEKTLEVPAPFAESIGQRVRRDRERGRFAQEVDANQFLNFKLGCDSVTKGTPEDGTELDGTVKQELLNFVGDWPSESLEQRGQRSQRSAPPTLIKHLDEETPSHVDPSCSTYERTVECFEESSLNKTEFLNDLDLLQGKDVKKIRKAGESSLSSLARDEQELSLRTEVRNAGQVLPDNVLECEILSESSTDPKSKDDSLPQPQNPSREIEKDENECKRAPEMVEADSEELSTSKGRIDVQTEDLEVMENYNLSLTPDDKTMSSSRCEADQNAESSKEKRKGSGRKTGKSCRLALTFTNQSSFSACLQEGSPAASPQLPDLMPPPQLEPPLLTTCHSASVQTDPLDFSLLWRINQKSCELDCSAPGLLILHGNPLSFVPKTNEDKTSGHQVPYRVCHEKGSQVEECDLGELPLKQQSLEMLRQHFKHVPIETLEDLYEKCHQDIDWTTNLLLDSGVELYRDDGIEQEDEDKDAEDNPVSLDAQEFKDKEGACASEITGHVPATMPREESRVDGMMMTEQASKDGADALVSLVPGTAATCCATSSTDGADPEDSARLDQSEGNQASDQDQKAQLDPTLDLPEERDTDAVGSESTPRSSSIEHLDQPYVEPGAPQDPCVSQISVQDLAFSEISVETSYQDCGERLEGWIKEEEQEQVRQEREEEDRVTKEEVEAITRSLLAQLEDLESKKEEERSVQGKSGPLDIQMLELKLPTELALQLTELFGPVGISPGEFSPEDCSVQMDLNLAKLLHQKWKETIQERHRQAALSYHLLQESSVHWGETQQVTAGQRDSAAQFLIGADGYSSLSNQSNIQESFPYMDHWNVSRPPVSLRNIMFEEQVMQESLEKSRLSGPDLEKKDGAAILKEKHLFTLFPTINRHFLRDIFRDNNYSLEQTEQFLHTLLDDGPVKNVVAADVSSERTETHRAHSKERKWKQKNEEAEIAQFQDTEDPEYEDFRTEAMLQRRRQQESFDKAAEAYRQGRKDVASFYAQQGHLHGQKMKEANHRAAVQIFERVNATLLPQNVLDLHGLHVDEALLHLQQVLTKKTSEWQQGLCRPQLSIITGRGNHSQGGVARVRPAVQDYLKSQHYRYSEPKLGLILVTLH